jgi:hypothetical protein
VPKASPIQNQFNAGELSLQLKGRTDIDKYVSGCETLENFLPQVHGPVRKRPGSRFVKEVKDSSKTVRLLSFEYSTEQAYILEFGDLYVRFYKDGGNITSGGSPYEIVSPYSHTEVFQLQYAQSADVTYISHPNHPPYKLARTGHTAWTLTEVDFDWPAFNDENSTTTTITASAVTGTGITLTASAATFEATHVGSYFRIIETIESKHDEWETAKSLVIGDLRNYNGNLYKATTAATTGTRPPIHTEGNETDGATGVAWDFMHDGAGYAKITAYTSSTVVTATVVKRLPDSSTGGSKRWSEGAWSSYRGYPKTVSFYEDRLWFAGSSSRPQTLWASTSGDYENHKYGTNDDDALNYTINSQEVNTIEWLLPGKVLSVGTSGSEFIVSASSLDEAITPTNVKIVPQTTYGSTSIRPIRIGTATVFVQKASRKVREFTYSYDNDSYVAPNLTLLAEHVTGTGVVDMAYQQEPSQILWFPCSCGTLVGLTYDRPNDVVAWHRQTLSGDVKSVATIPHWDADQDSTWLVVERTINGNTVKYIEYIEKYLADSTAFFVDSGLTYNGAPATVISGLGHLEGETVSILTDGYAHPSLVVTSGSITLGKAASVVSIGLPVVSILKTMPLEAGAADGTAQGKTMRITNVVVRFFETGPQVFYGADTIDMNEYHMRKPAMAMGAPVDLFTGDTEPLPWPEGYEVSPQVTLQHKLPLPCTILAVMPQVHTYDR